jgi:hypothetical protein
VLEDDRQAVFSALACCLKRPKTFTDAIPDRWKTLCQKGLIHCSPDWTRHVETLKAPIDQRKAIGAIACKLLAVIAHVLTGRQADRAADPQAPISRQGRFLQDQHKPGSPHTSLPGSYHHPVYYDRPPSSLHWQNAWNSSSVGAVVGHPGGLSQPGGGPKAETTV